MTRSSFLKLVTEFVGGTFAIVGTEGIIRIAKSRDRKSLPPPPPAALTKLANTRRINFRRL